MMRLRKRLFGTVMSTSQLMTQFFGIPSAGVSGTSLAMPRAVRVI